MSERGNCYVFGESAVSLRNQKSLVYSFSRAERFRNVQKGEGSQFVQLPTTLSQRAPSQGYGKRWNPTQNRSVSPAPGTYNVPSSFNQTIGPKMKKDSPFRNFKLIDPSPGPGTYEVTALVGADSPKFSFRPKLVFSKYNQSPSPNLYIPKLMQNTAFKNISFGFGERSYYSRRSETPVKQEINSDYLRNCYKQGL
jgi:hypothetical protein